MNNETKDRIAGVVRSFEMIATVPGGMCIFRALCGQIALKACGIEARIAAGGMLYRAGPDELLDVCAFAGRDFGGQVTQEGAFLGHFWLETKDQLIDFSAGDWRETADGGVDVFDPTARPIDWVKVPPDYYWRPKEQFEFPCTHSQAPELGRAWYTGWSANSLAGPEEVLRQVWELVFSGREGEMLIRAVYQRARA